MLTYSKLRKKPKLFRSFTGLDVSEFDIVYAILKKKHKKHEAKRLSKRERINTIGQGRKFNLELIDQFLLVLIYYRMYVSYSLAGFLVNLDQSNVQRNIKYLEPLVKTCVPIPERVYKQSKKITTPEELLQYYPDMKAIIDATEQEIQRPKHKRRRDNHYSGKKKKHTVKNQMMVNKKGLIIHKTGHDRGRKHDYDVFKNKHPVVPTDVEAIVDLGYQGIEKDYPDMKTRIPRKKPKGKERTKKDRRYNKKLSKERIIVEHVISRMKKYEILGRKFRNRLNRHDNVSSIISGLVNLRVMINQGWELNKFIG